MRTRVSTTALQFEHNTAGVCVDRWYNALALTWRRRRAQIQSNGEGKKSAISACAKRMQQQRPIGGVRVKSLGMSATALLPHRGASARRPNAMRDATRLALQCKYFSKHDAFLAKRSILLQNSPLVGAHDEARGCLF